MLNPYRYNIPTLKLKYSKRNGKCEWTLKIFRVLRLQAVKGLRFPSLIPPDWDVIAFLDICSPQFPFLPILLPFLLLPSWEICLVTALRHFLVCQAAGCLYWIISQSKSRARGGWGLVQATSKLGSPRHQKYKWTDRLHDGRGGYRKKGPVSLGRIILLAISWFSHIKVCLEMNVMMSLVIEAVMTHDNFISSKIFFKSLFVSIRHQLVRDTLSGNS